MKAFITGLLKGRKSRLGLLAVVLAAAGLSIAWLGPEHYRLGGAFWSDPARCNGNYWSAFQAPLDAAGKTAALRVNMVKYSASVGGLLAAFGADTITEFVGQVAMIDNDTAQGTIAGYLLKQGVPPELKAIWIWEGVIEWTGPNSYEAIGVNKIFLPSADANGDGLPDPGATPVIEVPMQHPVNRIAPQVSNDNLSQ